MTVAFRLLSSGASRRSPRVFEGHTLYRCLATGSGGADSPQAMLRFAVTIRHRR